MREEGLELAIQLRSERLVVAQDQGRTLETLDDVGHREGLSGAGHAQERDITDAFGEGIAQAFDGGRLVPGWLVFGLQLEFHTAKLRFFQKKA